MLINLTKSFNCVPHNLLNGKRHAHSPGTGRTLNVHKTFKRRPGRLLNALCTFNLRPVSRGYGLSSGKINLHLILFGVKNAEVLQVLSCALGPILFNLFITEVE